MIQCNICAKKKYSSLTKECIGVKMCVRITFLFLIQHAFASPF